jgi:FixJ family two-component response regulator
MAAKLRNGRRDKPKFMGHRHCTDGILAHIGQFHADRRHMKKVLVSVVDDDGFFRESMCRLMRSLGHTVDVFSSAAEFLASPRLAETACLIADIHMPAMTGLELCGRLIDTGHAIPTILVTAFPNDVDRARALNDGVMCYLRKPVDEEHLTRCVREALRSADSLDENS